MTKTIENLFVLLGTISDLLPVFYLLVHYHYVKNYEDLKILVIGCSTLFILNTVNYFGTSSVKNVVYPLFTLCEFTIVALFLRYHIKNRTVKRCVLISIPLFFLFILIEFFFVSLKGVDSVPIGVESIVILVFSFYYLYEQMNDVSAQFIYNKYHFWIVAGLMIYLAGSFFIYVFANQVDLSILQQWWIITVILYIVKNIFFLIGISLFIRQKKQPPRMDHSYYPYLN